MDCITFSVSGYADHPAKSSTKKKREENIHKPPASREPCSATSPIFLRHVRIARKPKPDTRFCIKSTTHGIRHCTTPACSSTPGEPFPTTSYFVNDHEDGHSQVYHPMDPIHYDKTRAMEIPLTPHQYPPFPPSGSPAMKEIMRVGPATRDGSNHSRYGKRWDLELRNSSQSSIMS